tara:strand:+ start:23250 stop:23633 length:384 start_codon:yes stop_codon:yes gene_type:complete
MSLGSRLREAREDKKLSAKELSELSGVPEKTIYRIETGEVQDPRLSTVKPILMALHCSSAIIFDEDEVFGHDDLTKSFLQTDALPDEDKKVIAEMVRRWTMVGYMETYFPKEFLSEVSKSNRHRDET